LHRLVSTNAPRRDFQKGLYIDPNLGEAQFAGCNQDEILVVDALRGERNQFRHGQVSIPDHHFLPTPGKSKIFAQLVLQFRHIHYAFSLTFLIAIMAMIHPGAEEMILGYWANVLYLMKVAENQLRHNEVMTQPALELLRKTLTLSDEERAELAGSLIDSLDATVDAATESAWNREIAQRIEDLDSGRAKSVPWEEVQRRISTKLKHGQ
jgi:putative addiction module component (TIGR02574 family)